jgi:hypothetical protein
MAQEMTILMHAWQAGVDIPTLCHIQVDPLPALVAFVWLKSKDRGDS